jgi:uncharacterized coiled-coil protein SlyX
MFRNICVFTTDEWTLYCEQMRHFLQTQTNPADVGLETVLPGVHQRFHSLESQFKIQVECTNELKVAVTDGLQSVKEGLQVLTESLQRMENRASGLEEVNHHRLVRSTDAGLQTFLRNGLVCHDQMFHRLLRTAIQDQVYRPLRGLTSWQELWMRRCNTDN